MISGKSLEKYRPVCVHAVVGDNCRCGGSVYVTAAKNLFRHDNTRKPSNFVKRQIRRFLCLSIAFLINV